MVNWIDDRTYVIEEKPSDEYIEKTSPIVFPTIEMSSPMNSGERLSDELSDEVHAEKGSSMGHSPESPSDELVQEAMGNLISLTECRCVFAGDEGHDVECMATHRQDVVVMIAAILARRYP